MRSDTATTTGMGRRTFLKASAGLAGATAAGATASAPAVAQDSGSGQSPFDGWFDNVSNYDGVVDMTGNSEVTVEVGASGNDGNFAFAPAAVRVDPGTTVVWEWTGQGGSHNVVAEDGSFESEMVGEQGHTFEQTVEAEGVTKYACSPHEAMGMKGALVVGDEAASSAPDAAATGAGGGGFDGEEMLAIGAGAALVAALLGLPVAEMRRRKEGSSGRS
jgi:halocyanin-like protein